MPSAFCEAKFLLDLVERGFFDADDARELIGVTPAEEALLLSVAETDFDRRLVRAAVTFRRQVLEQFDRLLAPPVEASLPVAERQIISFLVETSEREARREYRLQRQSQTL